MGFLDGMKLDLFASENTEKSFANVPLVVIFHNVHKGLINGKKGV